MSSLPDTFRAYVFEEYGDALEVIKLRTNMKHEALTPDQVRIRVHASALNPADYKFAEHQFSFIDTAPSVEKPYRVGFDVAGTIVEVGASSGSLQVGDQVYGMAYHGTNGTHGEFVVLDASFVALKPKNMTFNEAAGVPAAAGTSYDTLVTYAKLKKTDRVLILGGSSATGAFGIQIAKAIGSYVVATTSTRNIDLVKSFGADQVIDYTTDKWSTLLERHSIDVIYDCGVEPQAWNSEAQMILKSDGTGRFFTIQPLDAWKESPINASFTNVYAKPGAIHFAELAKLVEEGKLHTPIDSVYGFGDLLDAMKKQKTNHTRGKVIIEVISGQE